MAVLEAAAVGLPILVRDIPVYQGWLVDGENCLKAATEKEFQAAMERLLKDGELRHKLGRNALTLAKRESLEELEHKLRNEYQTLLLDRE